MRQLTHEDISLYPMTMDIKGQRTHQEYVDSMALMFLEIMSSYRLDADTVNVLALYAEQEAQRLWSLDK